MRILIANYRYFISGGPERYMFNVTDVLQAHGHDIMPFSIHYEQNRNTPYSRYFVEPLGSRKDVTFREQGVSLGSVYRSLSRLFYSKDVEHAADKIISDTNPHIAYVLHYLRKLSPSLLVSLKKAGLPVVVRLSDYTMTCPQAHHLRNEIPCELCSHENLRPSVVNRCVQDSYIASLLNYLATLFHRNRRYFDLVDVFVTTNKFMYETMLAANYPKERLRCIPTFVDTADLRDIPSDGREDLIVFNGRVVPIKGVHVLLDAFAIMHRRRPDLATRLKILGNGDEEYMNTLKRKVRLEAMADRIEFCGFVNANEVTSIVRKAKLSVVPSICYENLPNALIESMACGTPVLASDLGSLSLSVENGKTGFLFRPSDSCDLANKMEYCLDNPQRLFDMSNQAGAVCQQKYSAGSHVAALEKLFAELLSREVRR